MTYEPMEREDWVRRLAAAFSRIVTGHLGDAVMEAVVREKDEHNYPVDRCPTHDYCDANEIMYEAWIEVFRSAPLESDRRGAAKFDEERAMWSDAWEMAMAHDYDAGRIL